MPLTIPGQDLLNRLTVGSSDRDDLVTVNLPTSAFGVDAAFEAELNIRPQFDQACPGNVAGIVADVYIEALHGERQLSVEQGHEILRRIKDELPWSVWSEIEAKATTLSDRVYKEKAA